MRSALKPQQFQGHNKLDPSVESTQNMLFLVIRTSIIWRLICLHMTNNTAQAFSASIVSWIGFGFGAVPPKITHHIRIAVEFLLLLFAAHNCQWNGQRTIEERPKNDRRVATIIQLNLILLPLLGISILNCSYKKNINAVVSIVAAMYTHL